jgi:hypothetical protein
MNHEEVKWAANAVGGYLLNDLGEQDRKAFESHYVQLQSLWGQIRLFRCMF